MDDVRSPLNERVAQAMFDAVDRGDNAMGWGEVPPIAKAYRDGAEAAIEELGVKWLIEAVTSAATWFDEYAELHARKATADGEAKARRNHERAEFLRKRLELGGHR